MVIGVPGLTAGNDIREKILSSPLYGVRTGEKCKGWLRVIHHTGPAQHLHAYPDERINRFNRVYYLYSVFDDHLGDSIFIVLPRLS
jgi:hypothetical protein